MLNYQSTSFHDSHYIRQVLGLKPAPEFEEWLLRMGIYEQENRLKPLSSRHSLVASQLARISL
jgi:ethanolamine ammonia-lyase large subunit